MFDIKKYEAVTMLDLPEAERERISNRAAYAVEGFRKLEMIEALGAQPLVSVLDLHNILRDDVSEKLMSREEVMANAPEQYDGYFQVPGTLE